MPFTAKLFRIPGPGGWTFVRVPEELAPAATHAWGRTPVTATVDGRTWETSVWRDRARGTLLAVPTRIRGTKGDGDAVEVDVHVRTAFSDEPPAADGPQPHVFTVGYEGATLESFVTTMLDHGVTRVVDVRYLPSSRKRGFSKTPLAAALAAVGIGYDHVRALGTPTETRRDRRGGMSWSAFERRYREHLRGQGEALATVAEWVRAAPVALVCFEADARTCHRSIVAEAIRDDGAARAVVHLDVG